MVKRVLLAFLLGLCVAMLVNAAALRNERGVSITPPELQGRVTVRSLEDAKALRARLIAAIFAGPLPSALPSARPTPSPFPEASDAELLSAGSYYLASAKPNGKLAIYHAGHKETVLIGGALTIRAMLAAGFDVLALSMPEEPHARFADDPLPLRPFLEPVALSLNYAMAKRPYTEVVMAGLSGGGWTTVVYSAIDTRIHRSYPIAGSWPFFLRKLRSDSIGDFEQQLPGLNVGYLDLYLLASSDGREQLQIFNRDDPCCFSGELPLSYHTFLSEEAAKLGGSFGMVIDANDNHTLSPALTRLIWR